MARKRRAFSEKKRDHARLDFTDWLPPFFHQSPFMDDQDSLGLAQGEGPGGDNQGRSPGKHFFNGLLNQDFGRRKLIY